jgi:hypothetical protein
VDKLLQSTDYIYRRRLIEGKWMINTNFHLEEDVNLLTKITFNGWLVKMYLVNWNTDSIKEILIMMKFTSKEQLIQTNSFGLEKDGNYTILNGERYIFKMDKDLNDTLIKDNILMIVKSNLVFNQLVYFFFIMMLKRIMDLQIIYIIIVGDPLYILLLIEIIYYWLKIIFISQYWKIAIQSLLVKDYLNSVIQQKLLSGSRDYLVIFVNYQYCGELFITFKVNQSLIVIIITDINYKGINLDLINNTITNKIINLSKDTNGNFLINYNRIIINYIQIKGNINNRNSPFIVGVILLRCLYPHRLAGTLVVT